VTLQQVVVTILIFFITANNFQASSLKSRVFVNTYVAREKGNMTGHVEPFLHCGFSIVPLHFFEMS